VQTTVPDPIAEVDHEAEEEPDDEAYPGVEGKTHREKEEHQDSAGSVGETRGKVDPEVLEEAHHVRAPPGGDGWPR
jgi:hypothetical protein